MFARRPERNALLDNAQPPADPPTPTRPQLNHFHSISISDLDASDRSPQCYAALLVSAYFVLGVLYYSYLAAPEKFTLIDALYFTVVTITTVGYGDVNDNYKINDTSQDKFFTALFVLLGVGIIGAAVGVVLSAILDREDELAERLSRQQTTETVRRRPSLLGKKALSPAQAKCVVSAAQLVLVLLGGTLIFERLEKVSLLTAFYWCCVSVTTVGYGDVAPETFAGKAFACVFLLVGTVLMAKSLGDIAGLPLEARRKRLEKKVLEQYGDHLDGEEFAEILRYAHSQGLCDSATSCSRTEFVLSMLLKLDKVDREAIQQCVAAFNGLDRDHSGRLDAGDVLAAADAVV